MKTNGKGNRVPIAKPKHFRGGREFLATLYLSVLFARKILFLSLFFICAQARDN